MVKWRNVWVVPPSNLTHGDYPTNVSCLNHTDPELSVVLSPTPGGKKPRIPETETWLFYTCLCTHVDCLLFRHCLPVRFNSDSVSAVFKSQRYVSENRHPLFCCFLLSVSDWINWLVSNALGNNSTSLCLCFLIYKMGIKEELPFGFIKWNTVHKLFSQRVTILNSTLLFLCLLPFPHLIVKTGSNLE